MRYALLFLAAFLASGVEMVEALTIVLAVGVTRGWRSTLAGAGAAGLALIALIAALGPAITFIPINVLRIVVGGLLLAFGVQWLRKAILRASGYVPLHDEDLIYTREREEARRAGRELRAGLDWYSFTLSFKGVFLEGLEVAFIVISFGTEGRGGVAIAAAAAGFALVIVAVTGVLARAPLSRVPENLLKFSVGLMLTTFGTFWGAEGTGVSWPGGDAALLGILGFLIVLSVAAVRVLRRRHNLLSASPELADAGAPR
jgi:uncharacterized membrane protein